MSDLLVTHGFVKKLAKNIRARYGEDVRHTDVLEAVAESFGWKADALLHMLKNTGREPVPANTSERPSHRLRRLLAEEGWSEVMAARLSRKLAAVPLVAVLSHPSGKGAICVTTKGSEQAQGHVFYARNETCTALKKEVPAASRVVWSLISSSRVEGLVDPTGRTDAKNLVGLLYQSLRKKSKDVEPLSAIVSPSRAFSKVALAFAHFDLGDPISARILLEEAFAQEASVVEAIAEFGGWEGPFRQRDEDGGFCYLTESYADDNRFDLLAFAFQQATESGFIEIVDGLPRPSTSSRPHEPTAAEVAEFLSAVPELGKGT